MSKDLTQGRPFRVLLQFSLPVIAGNLFQLFYTLADTVIVGRTLGAQALAAVGSTTIVIYFVLCFVQGFTGGFGICLAQRFGARDENGQRSSAAVSWLLSAGFAVIITVLFCAIAHPILRWMRTPEDIYAEAYSYMFIVLLGTGATVFYNMISNMLRSLGDSRTPLFFLIFSALLNVVLDLVFILPLGMGVAGAAWATAASQAISAVLCILYLRRKAPELIFARADCRMDGELLKQTAHFSFVTALHQSSLYIGKLLVQGAVNTGGTDMISAYTATTRIEGFANSFGDSGSAATSVLVAQNRGAGKEERVKESFRSSLFLMLAMGLAMSLIMYVSASTSVGFMLGTRSGAAFDKFCEVSPLIEMRGKGMTFLGKHEVFAHMGKPCRKRKTFVRDALCLLNFCKVKLFYNSSKW